MPPPDFARAELPANITIDTQSKYALMGAAYNNAFCGLMSVPDGVIYVAPYTQMPNRPNWDATSVADLTEYLGDASCADRRLSDNFRGGKICHQEGGIPGHEQLMIWLNSIGVNPEKGFVGFSIIFGPSKGGFGSTSRSQNNQMFFDWQFGSKDKAFSRYHAQSGVQGAPNYDDVGKGSGGMLPDNWARAIKQALADGLGSPFLHVIDGSVGLVTNPAVSAGPPPPTNSRPPMP